MPNEAAPRVNKRRELGARSRDEILNAALRMMSVYGYEGTSVARIASESGLPSSSIYWHFGSKSGVLVAVMERSAEQFFTDSLVESADLPPREHLRQTLRAAGRTVQSHPEFLRLLFLLALSGEHDERVDRVVRSVTERGRATLHTLLTHAFGEAGEAESQRVADHLADFAQGVFDGAFMASQTHPGLDYLAFIDRMADALLASGDALLAPTTAATELTS